MEKRKFTYTVNVVLGDQTLTTKKNDFSDVEKLVEVIYDLGGFVTEIIVNG